MEKLDLFINLIITIVGSVITAVIAIGFAWGKFTQRFDDLTQGFDDFRERFNKVESKVDGLGQRMSNIEGRLGVGYTASSSPIHLTEKGEKVLIESRAKEIVDEENNKIKILDKIKAEPKPLTAYDVQEKTKKVIKELADDPMFNSVKDYAFQQGTDLSVILDIVAIYFRDIALKELGFKVEDIDN